MTDEIIAQMSGLIVLGFSMSLLAWFIGWSIAKLFRMFADFIRG